MKNCSCAGGNAGCLTTADRSGPAALLKSGAAMPAAAGVLYLLAFLVRFLPALPPVPFAGEALFIISFIVAGAGTLHEALRDLWRGRLLQESFLISLAGLGALAIGELPEAAALMILFNFGELLENGAVNRSRRSIAALMETKPDYANLVTAAGGEKRVNPEAVQPGEEIIVRPGEKIALDGVVVAGSSRVNNAALTGEAESLRVKVGDPVLAGAINGPGLLRIRVSRPFGRSSLARIYELVRESAARKAPTERFITTFARYYTPAVVVGALLLAIVPPLVLPGAAFGPWIYRALVFLVISCPCALVISIPLAYLGGIGAASREGILVKGSNFLEALRQVKVVAFDKTGTVTDGFYRVKEILPVPGMSAPKLLYWAAHAEAYSTHPLACSIRKAYGGELQRVAISAYEEIEGFGIRATVEGKKVLAGSLRFLQQEGIAGAPENFSGKAVHLALEGCYIGALMLAESLRPGAALAVRQLKGQGVKRTALLTGDQGPAAEKAADAVGIESVYSSLLPEEKVAHLEELLKEARSLGGKLAYVGDGINDAPALSRADIGIAMGGAGSDAAIEVADVVIMDDALPKIARAAGIGAFTHSIVRQNIIFALAVKAFFLAAGAFGAASIWGALFADLGVTLLAIANTARTFWPRRQEGRPSPENYLPLEGNINQTGGVLDDRAALLCSDDAAGD